MDIFKKWKQEDVKMMSPLKLAYIGDSVYEVAIRRHLLETVNASMNKLHKEGTNYVKAKAQADIVHMLDEFLTEEEKVVVKRGRNAKSGTIPKNAQVTDYKYATGFEALIGYLYLSERMDRIEELLEKILKD